LDAISSAPPHPELTSDDQIDLVLSFVAYIKAHGAIPVMIKTPQMSHWDYAAAFIDRFVQRCPARRRSLERFPRGDLLPPDRRAAGGGYQGQLDLASALPRLGAE
jgi:hypothetical protein